MSDKVIPPRALDKDREHSATLQPSGDYLTDY
jgi:hypothetical protein